MNPQKLPPLTIEDLKDSSLVAIDKKTLQLQVDAINLLENRVDASSFPPEYLRKIENYYRFAPVSGDRIAGKIAMMSVGRNGKG
jgi:hypothetical protein